MTPEEFKAEAINCIDYMLEKGFVLQKGAYGLGNCGCALTAIYLFHNDQSLSPYVINGAQVDMFIIDEFKLSISQESSFIGGFDDGRDDYSLDSWHMAGKEIADMYNV